MGDLIIVLLFCMLFLVMARAFFQLQFIIVVAMLTLIKKVIIKIIK